MSLVLSRKYRESIMIGEDIEITFLGMKGNSAHLGISAPANIRIDRREVYERIKNSQAVHAEIEPLNEVPPRRFPILEETI